MDSTMTPERAGLSRGKIVFVSSLLLIGLGFLAYAAARAWRPDWFASPGRDLAQEAKDDLESRGVKPLSQSLKTLLEDTKYKSIPTQTHALLGEAASDFTLDDSHDKPWHLKSERKDGPMVLVFYLGYTCNHCVSQLFALNQDIEKFRELGAKVVAISPDATDLTRRRFKKYGSFDFAVLSDPDNKVAQTYGVYRPGKDGKKGDLMHGTFIIDRRGKVVWASYGDEPFTENRTLLIELAKSEGRLPKTVRGE